MMMPKFSVSFLLHDLTDSSMSKLIHLPPTGVCLVIVFESSTVKYKNKIVLPSLQRLIKELAIISSLSD